MKYFDLCDHSAACCVNLRCTLLFQTLYPTLPYACRAYTTGETIICNRESYSNKGTYAYLTVLL